MSKIIKPFIDIPSLNLDEINSLQNRNSALLDDMGIGAGNKSFRYVNRHYDAIVAPKELGGDYNDIQKAIDAGFKRIFVRAGTYKISADIVLTDEISIVGENCGLTILDFDNNNVEMKAGNATSYSTGTLSIPNDSKIITGSGTSWSANVSAGDWIKLGNYLYEVDSVDSNTQITLLKNYKGIALSGDTYRVATFLKNITIKNLSFKNLGSGSAGNINFKNIKNSLVKDCKISGNNNAAIYMASVYNTIIRDNNFSHCFHGINGNANNCFNIISGNNINNNDQACILLSSTDKYNKIVNNELNNSDDGIRLIGDNNIVSQNHICHNHLHGIDLTGDNNIITNNNIKKNTANITNTGNGNIIIDDKIFSSADTSGLGITASAVTHWLRTGSPGLIIQDDIYTLLNVSGQDDEIRITDAGLFEIHFDIGTDLYGGTDARTAIWIEKNGTKINNSEVRNSLTSTSRYSHSSMMIIESITKNDVIRFRIQRIAGSGSVRSTSYVANFSIKKIR